MTNHANVVCLDFDILTASFRLCDSLHYRLIDDDGLQICDIF